MSTLHLIIQPKARLIQICILQWGLNGLQILLKLLEYKELYCLLENPHQYISAILSDHFMERRHPIQLYLVR